MVFRFAKTRTNSRRAFSLFSSSFRAERGRRSRDAADADDAAPAAHSIICGKMKSFLLCVCVFFCVRERESNGIRQNCIFFTLFYSTSCVEPSVRPSLSLSNTEAREERNSSSRAFFKKICRNTRVDSHSHNTHALKTFTSSRPRKKKRERERERGTFHSRARSFLLRREEEFPPLNLSSSSS